VTPVPRNVWTLDTRHVGRRVEWYDSLPSTNDLALARSEPGTAFVADVQTAGRGQYQRRWQSRPGCSLLASVCVPRMARPAVSIAWTAVAVCETIADLTAQQARIKWPNDILLDGKKVCGILTETQSCTVIGIGLNLLQTVADFESETLPGATSLALATGASTDAATVLRRLLQKLDESFERIQSGELDRLERAWKSRLGLAGRHVSVTLDDGSTVGGRLQEFGFDGLELAAGDGAFQVIAPEHVRAMSPA